MRLNKYSLCLFQCHSIQWYLDAGLTRYLRCFGWRGKQQVQPIYVENIIHTTIQRKAYKKTSICSDFMPGADVRTHTHICSDFKKHFKQTPKTITRHKLYSTWYKISICISSLQSEKKFPSVHDAAIAIINIIYHVQHVANVIIL